MLHKKILLYGFLGLTSILNAQTFDSLFNNKLNKKLDSLKNSYAIKGIVAGVYFPGKGKWIGTSGVSYNNIPISSNMQFGIASNTKLFTAVALLKLVENNILSIDDSIGKWLPPIKYVNPNITIRQILNHTSGIADFTNYPGYSDTILANTNRNFKPFELLPMIGNPLFPAGANSFYSNSNYLLAGMIFQSAYKKNISTFIRDSILNPLKLDSTFFDVAEVIEGEIAHPWQNGKDIDLVSRVSLNSAAWAAGAMYSNINEMIQWYDALLNNHFLSETSFSLLTTFVGSLNYGLGISKQTMNNRITWGHGGDIRGYKSRIIYDTLSKSIICVLANSNPLDINFVATELMKTVFENNISNLNSLANNDFSISIFPNPFIDCLNINIPFQKIISIQLLSIEGKKMGDWDSSQLFFKELKSGPYFLIINTDKGSYKKLVIKS